MSPAPPAIGFDATLVRRDRVTGTERYIIELLHALGTIVPPAQPVLVFCRPEGRERLSHLPPHFRLVVGPTDNRVLSDQLWLPAAILRHWPAFVHYPSLAPGFVTPRPFVLTVLDLTHRLYPETSSFGGRYYYGPLFEVAIRSPLLRHVITISKATADGLAQVYGRLRPPVTPVLLGGADTLRPVAPDVVERVRARFELPARYVLAVGTIEPRKNLRVLLEAMARLGPERAPGVVLALVGRQGWGKLIPGAAERTRPLGRVSDEELAALYCGATCFVSPSLYEGFGLPLLEAMGCGTPCLAADIAVYREVGGDACLFADPHDPEAFAAAIVRLVEEPELRERCREAGRRRAAELTYERTGAATWAIYRSLLGAAVEGG
jgi:glycosyltransferase involved in cell wall biosynthesis